MYLTLSRNFLCSATIFECECVPVPPTNGFAGDLARSRGTGTNSGSDVGLYGPADRTGRPTTGAFLLLFDLAERTVVPVRSPRKKSLTVRAVEGRGEDWERELEYRSDLRFGDLGIVVPKSMNEWRVETEEGDPCCRDSPFLELFPSFCLISVFFCDSFILNQISGNHLAKQFYYSL